VGGRKRISCWGSSNKIASENITKTYIHIETIILTYGLPMCSFVHSYQNVGRYLVTIPVQTMGEAVHLKKLAPT